MIVQLSSFLNMLGGLALFLYGMQMMGSGLEAAAGNRMKQILEKLTANRFLAVIVGAIITAVIQSSSATTVMVVGFVNSGMMTLHQAVWIIMGANVGTTITSQLIALDFDALAPLFAFIGVAMVVFLKKPQIRHWGQILAGLGVLFIGMNMMSTAMIPLRESKEFVSLMTQFSNPFLGIIAGAIFTALIQSSSASVGILQALAKSGAIDLSSAVFVLFGQNIGTCITAILASLGTSRSAKRATVIHLLFNVLGTALFTFICIITPFISWIEALQPGNPTAQIANMHTIFNVATTIILLPFGSFLATLAQKILPELPTEKDDTMHLAFLPAKSAPNYRIGNAAIAATSLWNEWKRMMGMVNTNVSDSFDAIINGNVSLIEPVEKREEYIDFLNKEIVSYITSMIAYDSNEEDSTFLSALFKATSDLERIGDHAMNICGYTKWLQEKNFQFSSEAKKELAAMKETSLYALSLVTQTGFTSEERLNKITDIEQKIDDMTIEYRQNQIKRMKQETCANEACVLYSEMLTDFERIGDHVLNLGQQLCALQFLVEENAQTQA